MTVDMSSSRAQVSKSARAVAIMPIVRPRCSASNATLPTGFWPILDKAASQFGSCGILFLNLTDHARHFSRLTTPEYLRAIIAIKSGTTEAGKVLRARIASSAGSAQVIGMALKCQALANEKGTDPAKVNVSPG